MSASGDTPLLEVKALSVAFGAGPPVLDGVSLTLRRNEIIGLVGETGSGKSLLARAIIDLLPEQGHVTTGEVWIEGQRLQHLSPARKRQFRGAEVALIGTNAKLLLDPVATVGAQVARVLRAHRAVSRTEARHRTIDVFRQVGIVDPEIRVDAYPPKCRVEWRNGS